MVAAILGQVLGVALLLILALHLVDIFARKKKDVRGKIVLITGSGSGLGRQLALRFSKERCRLVLWDVNEEAVQKVAEECTQAGAESATAAKVDLSDRHSVRAAGEKVNKEIGDVDILVNNAGIVTGKKLQDCSEELIIKTVEVNTLALFWTTRAFLPAMLRRNSGHLVTIASMAGLCGVNGLADYCASKYGAVGFNESMRFELKSQGKYGIKTTVVCPFYINTGMFDGVATKSPNLLPILQPDYAVTKIYNAILTDCELLIMPRFAYFLALNRAVFPVFMYDWVMNFLGVNDTMDDFKGRPVAGKK